MTVNNRLDPPRSPVVTQPAGIERIRIDDDKPTKTGPVDQFGGQGPGANVQRGEPPMPVAEVRAPTHYEPAPSIDELAAGAATLELGHKGPAVHMLQQALNKMGANPPLKEDGFLGPKTLAALQQFQQKAGVSPGEHGSVGGKTLEALGANLTSEDYDRMRDRAAAHYAISSGGVSSVGRKPPREVTGQDIDRALGETEWTPEMQQNVGNYKPMSQSDYRVQLGNGDATIRSAGCMLTAYTMAASGLTGNQSLNPKVANDMVRRAGGFSGSSLIGPRAAEALGMREVTRTGVHRTSAGNMQNQIDAALAKGQAVVLGVDYKEGSRGTSNGTGVDHWITITGKDAQGRYIAIDPVGGKTMTLTPDAQGRLVGTAPITGARYVGKEAVVLEKR